jgi:hypothetical protein
LCRCPRRIRTHSRKSPRTPPSPNADAPPGPAHTSTDSGAQAPASHSPEAARPRPPSR